jgi:mono/diheme cytochrome c family protein
MPTIFPKKLFLLVLLGILLVACSKESPDATQPDATATTTTVTVTATTAPIPAGEVSFSADVLPIFEANCTRCHGSTRQNGGLELNSYTALMAGSSDGAVIIPMDAAGSKLIELITSGAMPKNRTPLSSAEITLISDWINAGAPDN